jgi:4-hydroxy-3-methylbut-2-enyl diphosphate reductase
MKILLAKPRGFCAGVDRAIEIVNRALTLFCAPIYVKHEVVHNTFVVDSFKKKGVIFIEDLAEVPPQSILIYSAHGVSLHVKAEAKQRNFTIFDATCPLVTKVHMEVNRRSKNQEECILIGHKGHPEVEGTMGQYTLLKESRQKNTVSLIPSIQTNIDHHGGIYLIESIADIQSLCINDPNNLYYMTQTTLSIDDTHMIIAALKKKYPHIKGPKKDDICYATQNRQEAVKQLAEQSDLILVVGSQNSSNSNRLKELAEKRGCRAYLIDNATEIKNHWLKEVNCIGVTAGASAPEILVDEVIENLKEKGGIMHDFVSSNNENMMFVLPLALR